MKEEKSKINSGHWADHVAQILIQRNPGKEAFVVASGISPSGRVHIGNFREVITVDFVQRALKRCGKEVKFIYSWDDYDAFRKVPSNLPQPEMLESHLRRPLSDVPDPFGKSESYATHFEKTFEKELEALGISPQYIYQNKAYRNFNYTEGIKTALEQRHTIKAILDKHRTTPLPENWAPLSIYCSETGKDECEFLDYIAPTTVRYRSLADNKERTLDFSKQPGVKLLWRVDWPMRWAHEKVDFEPGGKDHSSQGGSFATAKEIIKQVWDSNAPHYQQYDFVMAKGRGGKMSSSKGELITLTQSFEVYEPSLVRYLFASRKPNMDFSIAFDLDVLKAYDDFDRTERIAWKVEPAEEKKFFYERAVYLQSLPTETTFEGSMPAQFPFRHLCNVIQIFEGDLKKAEEYYSHLILCEEDRKRFYARAQCAWNWIGSDAPEAFTFSLRKPELLQTPLVAPQAILDLAELLQTTCFESDSALADALFEIIKKNDIEAKVFFQDVYQILIGKTAGPKMAHFIRTIGPVRVVEIIKGSLSQ